LYMGGLLAAREHLEIAISLYDRERHRPLNLRYFGGIDAGVHCLAMAGSTLWNLGYPDQALERCNEALALAQGLSHPHSVAFAELAFCALHQLRGAVRAVQRSAENMIAISAEGGLSDLLALATSLRGWAVAAQGRPEEGIPQIREGLAASRATGVEINRPYILILLAEACMRADRLDEGLNALTEAAAAVGEIHLSEPGIDLLRGALLLKQDKSNAPEAQRCFERAAEIARKQSVKSLELLATSSLAWLLAKQDRRDEARTMLTDIYGWFTEGFDTADLRDAKALLDELKD
jgi:predicted ATPase